jgi:proteasome accessory factor C
MVGSESATARLGRLLIMVPWLMNRQGIDITEAAEQLGVSAEQVVKDLQLLFLCGLPGHLPDDLIEAEWEDGRVYLRNADTIGRPLRLTLDEATALIVGLRALAAVPGIGERDAVERALTKLVVAAGELAEASERVQVSAGEAPQEVLATCQRALQEHLRLHLEYLVLTRDEQTSRDVDPMQLVNLDGHWYLEAWCHRAQAVRLFRLDRVLTARILAQDGTPPADATPRDLSGQIFQPGPQDLQVLLRLSPQASWVAEYYPVEILSEEQDGSRQVSIRTGDPGWIRHLVWRLGGAAQVLSPQDLADSTLAGAEQALGSYSDHVS